MNNADEINKTIEECILRSWVNHVGTNKMLDKYIEELAELLTVLCQRRNKPVNKQDLVTEVADVGILLDEIKMSFNIFDHEVQRHRKVKINKVKGMLYKDKVWRKSE